jgi:hypothetical protein
MPSIPKSLASAGLAPSNGCINMFLPLPKTHMFKFQDVLSYSESDQICP